MENAIDQIRNAAELNALPTYLRLSIRSVGQTTCGLYAYKSKAERKAAIQAAVRRARDEGAITQRLAIEFLQQNQAYGPKGKAILGEV